jgi:uncharacterized repeat protein (TIGR01451 family)
MQKTRPLAAWFSAVSRCAAAVLAVAMQLACGSTTASDPSMASVDLSVTMTPSVDRLRVGETVGYGIRVTNAGPADAGPVGFSAFLTSQDDLRAVTGNGWLCVPHTGNFVTCERSSLPARASSELTMTRRALEPGQLQNTVEVEARGQTDANPANNRTTVAVRVD